MFHERRLKTCDEEVPTYSYLPALERAWLRGESLVGIWDILVFPEVMGAMPSVWNHNNIGRREGNRPFSPRRSNRSIAATPLAPFARASAPRSCDERRRSHSTAKVIANT